MDCASGLTSSEIYKINFKEENEKAYFKDNIISYLKNIINTPINLLIACPINDITGLYMLDNKIKLLEFDYIKIKKIISKIKEYYEVNIKYPYNIQLNNKKYRLHSFILLINHNSINSHFVYYKIDKDNVIRFDDLNHLVEPNDLKFFKMDGNVVHFKNKKLKINKDNIKDYENNKDYSYVSYEYNLLFKEDSDGKYIEDCLSHKVIFCYYKIVKE